jgi:predicted RNA-binding Zn-ribbon protein involved in translation (DUF1610 family)
LFAEISKKGFAPGMEFIFICPKRNMTFESADFKVTENKGVISDSSGNKTLDAKVELNDPCPFCGEKHVYRASELPCPFEVSRGSSGAKEGNQ